jgi:hypothetical protein
LFAFCGSSGGGPNPARAHAAFLSARRGTFAPVQQAARETLADAVLKKI